jgi:glycosyltransferase involved in cell wall biosynthesis
VPADIIHFHDPELLLIGFLLKNGKRRLIYDSHEDVPKQILTKHYINPLARKAVSVVFELLENYISKRLDAVVCATPSIARRFNSINSLSVNVNNFPRAEEFQPLNSEKLFSRTLCYIGGITRERGITEVIQALAILKNVNLIMCGPFESQDYADELMSMAGWKYVDYRGTVGRHEVGKIMACCMAGIVTFLPSPNHYDSQPNKMFEYMSAGLALIASDFPLWRQIIEEGMCGLCVDPSSPQDIANGINALLGDEKLCRDRGKAGREAVITTFNWRKESEKLLKLYEAIG